MLIYDSSFFVLGFLFISLGIYCDGLILRLIFIPVGLLFIGYRIYLMCMVSNRKKKTDKEGEDCFAYVKTVEILRTDCLNYQLGSFYAYIATIGVYVPSIKKATTALKLIGYTEPEFNEGDFLEVKYLLGEMNIKAKAQKEDIPREALEALLGLNKADGERNLQEVDTQDWIVTEEAYDEDVNFDDNFNGVYHKAIEDEKTPTKHYTELQEKKIVRRRGTLAVVELIMLMLAATFLLLQ